MIGTEPGLSIADWVTILLSVAGFLIAQFWAAVRYLSGQFAKRDESLEDMGAKLEALAQAMRKDTETGRDNSRNEIARIDRDIALLRSEVRERLAVMPTRADLETALHNKIAPIEADLRALVLQLARSGLDVSPPRARRQPDDGN